MTLNESVNPEKNLKSIVFFLIAVMVISALFDYPIFTKRPFSDGGWGLYTVMWVPALCAVLANLLFKLPMKTFGYSRFGSLRYYILAVMIPLLVMGVPCISLWGLGLADVHIKGVPWSHQPGWFLKSYFFVIGEEIGWRGFLQPRIRAFLSLRTTALVVGIAWTAWHIPAIAYGCAPYTESSIPLWFGLSTFLVGTVALSYIMGWIWEATGSLWVVVLIHASSNRINSSFSEIFVGKGSWFGNYFVNDQSAIEAIFLVLVAIFLAMVLSRKQFRRDYSTTR